MNLGTFISIYVMLDLNILDFAEQATRWLKRTKRLTFWPKEEEERRRHSRSNRRQNPEDADYVNSGQQQQHGNEIAMRKR